MIEIKPLNSDREEQTVYIDMVDISHEIRHGVMVTQGYLGVLLDHFRKRELNSEMMEIGMNGTGLTLFELTTKILASQARIIESLQRLENCTSRTLTETNKPDSRLSE